MKNLRKILSENDTVFKNISYLTVLQSVTLLIPLITYPYLIKVLGEKLYGTIIFVQSIMVYFNVFVSFGFDVIAARDISVCRDDTKQMSKIVSSITQIKSIFFVMSLFVITIFFICSPREYNYALFYISFWLCISNITFPIWFFQGIEKMKYITVINVISKLISVVLIFILIKSPKDYLLFPLINMGVAIIIGGVSFYVLFNTFGIEMRFVSYNEMKNYIRKTFPLFTAHASTSLYVGLNRTLLGLVGMEQVAYYDLADKIVSTFKIPHNIISQVVFPKISNTKNKKYVLSVFKITLLFNVLLYIVTFIFSDFLISLLRGDRMEESVMILKILGLTIPVVGISNVFGILTMIPFGYEKKISKVIFLSGVIFSLLVIILYFSDLIMLYTLSSATLFTEIMISIMCFYYVKKYKILK